MITGISIILFFVALLNAVKGLDLKTKRGWFYVFCGFLAGLLYGLSNNMDLNDSAGGGLFISLVIVIAGLSHQRINRMRSKYKEYLDS